jgi:hypothetical protein
MKLPSRALCGFLLLVLCGCVNRIHDPGATEDLQVVEVSATEVEVGEPVRVTVAVVYRASVGSYSPTVQVGRVRIAACFDTDALEIDPSCERLPDSLTLLEGVASYQDIGQREVERGEELRVEHTFAFTSTVPQTVEIQAALQTLNDLRIERTTEPLSVAFQ